MFFRWLHDGNFYVLEVGGKVIGCAKLTILPRRIGLLEGLRVHPRYQKVGYGRILHEFIVERAEELANGSRIYCLQFCTYYLNVEVLHLAKVDGFKVVKQYFYVQKSPSQGISPDVSHIGSFEELNFTIPQKEFKGANSKLPTSCLQESSKRLIYWICRIHIQLTIDIMIST